MKKRSKVDDIINALHIIHYYYGVNINAGKELLPEIQKNISDTILIDVESGEAFFFRKKYIKEAIKELSEQRDKLLEKTQSYQIAIQQLTLKQF